MSHLAACYGDSPVPIRQLAEDEQIPFRYLEQIMTKLRREGLLESIRGPGGGYQLNRPPAKISIGDIIRVLEGSISVSRCLEENVQTVCPQAQTCSPRTFWKNLSQTIESILDDISLEQFIDVNWSDVNLIQRFTNQGQKECAST